MLPSRSRRRALLAVGAASASVLFAGCTSDIHYPEDLPGQPDLTLKNCHSEREEVHVVVTHVASGSVVHDRTHSVPGDFCSDVGPSYHVEDVWTDPGEYSVRAEVEGAKSAERTVTLSAHEVNADTGSRAVHVDDGEIDIA